MVLVFSFSVSAGMLLTGVLIVLIVLTSPGTDIDGLVRALTTMTASMMGALLGLLAGKSETMNQLETRPDGSIGTVNLSEPESKGTVNLSELDK